MAKSQPSSKESKAYTAAIASNKALAAAAAASDSDYSTCHASLHGCVFDQEFVPHTPGTVLDSDDGRPESWPLFKEMLHRPFDQEDYGWVVGNGDVFCAILQTASAKAAKSRDMRKRHSLNKCRGLPAKGSRDCVDKRVGNDIRATSTDRESQDSAWGVSCRPREAGHDGGTAGAGAYVAQGTRTQGTLVCCRSDTPVHTTLICACTKPDKVGYPANSPSLLAHFKCETCAVVTAQVSA